VIVLYPIEFGYNALVVEIGREFPRKKCSRLVLNQGRARAATATKIIKGHGVPGE
jgi:hypothetical protein